MSFNKNDFKTPTTAAPVKGRKNKNTDEDGEIVHEYATRGHCSYCFRERANTVGITATRAKAWFCSGLCSHAYHQDNSLATYHQSVQFQIAKHRDNHEAIKRRKFKLGLPTR